MSLAKAMDNLKLDVRMREINLKNGTLTEAEIKESLSKLPDMSERAESLEIESSTQESQH